MVISELIGSLFDQDDGSGLEFPCHPSYRIVICKLLKSFTLIVLVVITPTLDVFIKYCVPTVPNGCRHNRKIKATDIQSDPNWTLTYFLKMKSVTRDIQRPCTHWHYTLQWRHNERNGVSNHQPHDCSLNGLFRRRSMKISRLRVTGICEGNSPVTGEFSAQRTSNAENVSILWRHHLKRSSPHKGPVTRKMFPFDDVIMRRAKGE